MHKRMMVILWCVAGNALGMNENNIHKNIQCCICKQQVSPNATANQCGDHKVHFLCLKKSVIGTRESFIKRKKFPDNGICAVIHCGRCVGCRGKNVLQLPSLEGAGDLSSVPKIENRIEYAFVTSIDPEVHSCWICKKYLWNGGITQAKCRHSVHITCLIDLVSKNLTMAKDKYSAGCVSWQYKCPQSGGVSSIDSFVNQIKNEQKCGFDY